MNGKLKVGLACNGHYMQRGIKQHEVERLKEFSTFEWREFNESSDWYSPPVSSSEVNSKFIDFASTLDALIVCHGSPRITGEILDAAPSLRLVGELEGDRFAQRIDVAACAERGVKAVDTTHASSLPVSEWALAMMMMGLKKVGAHYRRMITDQEWGTGQTAEDGAGFPDDGRLDWSDRWSDRRRIHRSALDRVVVAVPSRNPIA